MITAFSSTTLSAALDARATRFALASTTGISGAGSLTTPASVLVVGGEMMLVQSVPTAGIVEVWRGFNGTRARAHASGAVVVYGTKQRFDFARNGEDGLIGLAGDPGANGLPFYRLPLGAKVMDPNTGYEYRLVDYQGVFAIGDWVVIDASGLASAISTGSKGRIGIVTEVTVSDNWGYVMVAGSATAKHTSDVTTACVLKAGAATVDISSSTGGNVISNAAFTAVGSSTADLGTVYIDNPWCYGITTDIVP